MKPLEEGEESATVWRQGDKLFHAVSVPMVTGGEVAGRADRGLRHQRGPRQRHPQAHPQRDRLPHPARPASRRSSRSRRWARRRRRSRALLGQPEFAAGGRGERALRDRAWAASGTSASSCRSRPPAARRSGSVVALRSLAVEMASFQQFRNSLVLVSLVVMAVALGLAFLAARQITGPVRTLAGLVEQARDGSYSGAVAVGTSDEIGVLARTFNSLLADLREKEQMIGFLREGMTMLRKGAGASLSTGDLDVDCDARRPDAAASATRGRRCREGVAVRGPLRDPLDAGQGRHGRRLPRPRPAARRDGGAQGAAPRRASRTTRRCSSASSRRSSWRARSRTGTSCAPTTSARPRARPTSRWSSSRA